MPISNPVIDQINGHATVRHCKPDPIPREWIEAIVDAGQRAATSSNLQMYAAIAVTDLATCKELAHWCGDQKQIEGGQFTEAGAARRQPSFTQPSAMDVTVRETLRMARIWLSKT